MSTQANPKFIGFAFHFMLWLRHHVSAPQDIWTQGVFQLHFIIDVVAVPHWRYPLAVQPQDELWILKKGRCRIQQNQRTATAKSGDIVVLRAGESRLTTEPDGEPLEIIGYGFGATLLATDIVSIWQPPLCLHNSSTRIAPLMDELARENLQRPLAYGLQTPALAQQILVEALRLCPPDPERWESTLRRLRAAQEGAVAGALRYIETNFQQPLQLEQIARAVHLSPKHLSRRFKNALGIAPSDYWRRYRLQQARQMILQNHHTFNHIAQHCGFEDAAYFSRAFKREFGISPQEFRNAARRMLTP